MKEQTLDVGILDGVNDEIQPTLYEAMRTCSNAQRLCICLYLMSDLPDFKHSLDFIEENLSRIFPESIPHGNTPDTYKDFAATAIRQYFNYETGAVRSEEITEEERMWHNPQRGYWRNTPIGNSYALRLLLERNIIIQKRGVTQEPTVPLSDHSKRRYLDENKASEMLNARRNVLPNVSEAKGNQLNASINAVEKHADTEEGSNKTELLNKILDLLHYLSTNSTTASSQVAPTILNMSGSPSLVFRLLASQQESNINIIGFHLSQQSTEWQVEIVLAD